jgi:hypothetical protein
MKEKEKSAESGEQKKLAKTVLAETHEDKCNAGGEQAARSRQNEMLIDFLPRVRTVSGGWPIQAPLSGLSGDM